MTKTWNDDVAAEWQRLMTEWSTVEAEYKTALKQANSAPGDSPARAAFLAKADNVKARLDRLQGEIDQLTKQRRATRTPVKDGLVVATLQPDPQSAQADDGAADAPSTQTKAEAGKR